jgi:hypothetical protein
LIPYPSFWSRKSTHKTVHLILRSHAVFSWNSSPDSTNPPVDAAIAWHFLVGLRSKFRRPGSRRRFRSHASSSWNSGPDFPNPVLLPARAAGVNQCFFSLKFVG